MQENKRLAAHQRLRDDLEFYCRKALFIKTKMGTLEPFIWNKAQHYIHEKIEEQRQRTGMVRAAIVKGRQQGCSTYVGGRYFHRGAWDGHKSIYILSHEGVSTRNLLAKAEIYLNSCHPSVRPEVTIANRNELQFKNGSTYAVGTAGAKHSGRGQTNQLLHACLAFDSKIVLANGATVSIEDIELGAEVVTSSGAVATVSFKTATGEKPVFEIKTWLSNESIRATAEHKIRTQRGLLPLSELSNSDWIQVPDVRFNASKATYEAYVPNGSRYQNNGKKHREKASIPLDYTFGYALGYYLAEGHIRKQAKDFPKMARLAFGFHEDENYIEIIHDWLMQFATSYSEVHTPDNHKKVRHYNGTFLAEMIYQICGRVESKGLPSWVFNGPEVFGKGILDGYLAGDGSKTARDRITAPSIHEQISRQMKRVVSALTPGVAAIQTAQRYRYGKACKPLLHLSIYGDALREIREYKSGKPWLNKSKIIDGKKYVKIRQIEPAGVARTYDIEVDHPDHDFETPVGVVSNSECAYYENTDAVTSGILQTVADVPGTEIIIESTANGPGDYFHTICKDAMAGRGLFILIFVPWHWQDEYVSKTPSGWAFSDEEKELQQLYELSDDQLYWRYLKTLQLGSERLFKQEYPFTVAEAFQSSGTSFIPAMDIQRARKFEINDSDKPLILGVDPGRTNDRTVLAYRRGRELTDIKVYDEMDSTTRLAGIIAREIERRKIAKVFIDVGLGYGTIDTLHDMGFTKEVTGVDFGSSPDEDRYLNKRAEMAFDLRDWLSGGGVSIPDSEEIESDLLSIPDFKQTSRGKLSLESKDKIREEYGRSPDIFDSICLTFAYPVASEFQVTRRPGHTLNTKRGSALKTLRRVRKTAKQEDRHDDVFDEEPELRKKR